MPDQSPFRLDLGRQAARAEALLRAARDGDADALRRFTGAASDNALTPADAERVIARELGLPGWPELAAHVAAMERSRADITRGRAAPDAGPRTLHLRCGSDIEETLAEAGFTGNFLEYSDPFCQGPVSDAPDWQASRAAFLAASYGDEVGRSHAQIAEALHQAEASLLAAAASFERIVLWFEHDSYDQLILARCLAAFAPAPPACLELVSPGHFPGMMRFIGLGQLPPEALRLLWEDRVPVTEDALAAGTAAWDALRAPDPRPLAMLAQSGTPGIPQLGRALRRHVQELPWAGDGLSMTQRLILQLVDEQPRTADQVFHHLMIEREPLPWMSDLIFLHIVTQMQRAGQKLFDVVSEDGDPRWFRQRLTITAFGRDMLAGKLDWMEMRPPERWVGGVRICAGMPCWRWDEATNAVLWR